MAEIKREIKKRYGRMSGEGYQMEVNLISWNGGQPKIDIRPWSEDGERCGKGITLTEEQVRFVAAILQRI